MRKLESNTKTQSPYISKFLYVFSLIVWCCSLIAVICSFVLNIENIFDAIQTKTDYINKLNILYIIIFIAIIFEGFKSGAFTEHDEDMDNSKDNKVNRFDYFFLVVGMIGALCGAICFVSILFAGGSPEIINDSVFCVVNHGELIGYITKTEFIYLSICDVLIFPCILLFFASIMAFRIRTLYFEKQHKKA